MTAIAVAVVNESTVLQDAAIAAVIPALQTQVSRDFAPVWGTDAQLSFVPKGTAAPAGVWCLTIFDNADQAGAMGYHELTNDGLPLGKVFAGEDLKNHTNWTVTVSHELLEMLNDPNIDLSVFDQPTTGSGKLYSYEACDACQADRYGYQIDGVLVTDFVYPTWFESFRTPNSTQFDREKHITAPFQLLPGGYVNVYDVAGGAWHQLNAQGLPDHASLRPGLGSRKLRRRTPRDAWARSVRAAARG